MDFDMHIHAEEDQLPVPDVYDDVTITEMPYEVADKSGGFQDAHTDMNLSAEKAVPITNLENKEAITKNLTTEPQSFDTMLGKVNVLPNGAIPTRVTKK